ncbi:DUF6651 domain-containing protein [Chromobacterium sp. ASV23]|uniref:DUF6651 domain-containing protein n=1 Tax=Chromobacterium sp. ASV23 TaxID=2795110 RepID=UPI0018EAE269|nr:DUF6651 domain-containing protein [Chromobacterium sp. ASV23]
MKFRNVWLRYHSPENGGEGGSAGGSGAGASANADAGDGDGGNGGPGAEGGADAGDNAGGKAEGGEGGKKSSMTDAEAKLLREVMQHKEKERRLAAELADLKSKIGDVDLEQARTLLQQKRDEEERLLAERGEWEALKKQMAERHQTELAAVQSQLAEANASIGKLHSHIEDLSVGSSFTTSEFIKNELVLTPAKARVIYGAHFDVVDGKVVAFDKPRGAGERAPLVNASGEHLGFDEALRQLVEKDSERDHLLRAKVKPGAGSGTAASASAAQSEPPKHGLKRIQAGLAKLGK